MNNKKLFGKLRKREKLSRAEVRVLRIQARVDARIGARRCAKSLRNGRRVVRKFARAKIGVGAS